MTSHTFLSPQWIAAARAVHDDLAADIDAPADPVRVNVTVLDAPFDDPEFLGHVDTTTGSIVPELGHIDSADVGVRIPYAIARQLLVDQDVEAIMIAFMSGQIEVEGDVTRLLDLQDMEPTAEQQAVGQLVASRLRDITA